MTVRDHTDDGEKPSPVANPPGALMAPAPGSRLVSDWSSASVTAEIAVIEPTVATPIDDALPYRRGRPPRRNAPIAVRLFVWLLFFCLLAGVAAFAVNRYHPDWFNFLRAQHHVAAGATTSGSKGHASGFRLVSETSSGATYAVPSSSYSLIITVASRCWTTVREPAATGPLLVAETLTPALGAKVVNVTGSSSVELDAQSISLAVQNGSQQVGLIKAPKVGYIYTFVPTTTG